LEGSDVGLSEFIAFRNSSGVQGALRKIKANQPKFEIGTLEYTNPGNSVKQDK
jgi:hypothetical protein